MLPLTALSLASLAFLSYRLSGRVLLYPAVVFCSAWASALTVLWVSGSLFYRLSAATLLTIVTGAAAFSSGCALGSMLSHIQPTRELKPKSGVASNRVLTILAVVTVCCAPLAIRWLARAVSDQAGANLLVRGYLTMLDDKIRDNPDFIAFSNVVSFSTVVAILAFLERKGHQARWLITALIALTLTVLIGGRSNIVFTILSLLAIDWLQSRRIRVRVLATLGSIVLLMAIAIAVLLGKAGASTESRFSENLKPVARGLALYAVGSIVAYDQVVREPDASPHNWQPTRFFEQRLHRIDKRFRSPDEYLEFVQIGPNQLTTNAYSTFFTLIDYGPVGVVVTFVALGWTTTLVHLQAVKGHRLAIVMYSALCPALILSIYGDYFFLALNYFLKVFCISWCVYSLPQWWSTFKSFARSRAEKLVAADQTSPI